MTVTNAEGNVVFYQQVFPLSQVSLGQGQSYSWNTSWDAVATSNGVPVTAGEYTLDVSIGGFSSQTTLALSN